jgi:outer membrane lipoprotein-sorting protein
MKSHRAATRNANVFRTHASFVTLLFVVSATLWRPANAEKPDPVPIADPLPLTAEEVAYNLAQMNLNRVQALHAYQGTRIYRAKYHGFPRDLSAEMTVKVKYLPPGKKEFAIESESGSKLIIDRVFKKLLDAEEEQQGPKIQRRSALTDDNYRFTLVRRENGIAGGRYVLEVEPKRIDKFLYHGRIWVDARDFAVVRLEAEPSKNPSFWTKKADIEQVYTKVSDFWLPANNHSITAIRLGGRANLTIEYMDYAITDASHVRSLAAPQPSLH